MVAHEDYLAIVGLVINCYAPALEQVCYL